ncbi:MAG TPA: alkaline phosphatase PhoX [Alphaproteobacteria bacterium]|nr:alkaline phosphatase PhoX [Alphaproteobacteria bacterium]
MGRIDREVDRRGFLRGAVAVGGGAILAPTFVQGLAARFARAAEAGQALPKAGKGEGGYGALQATPDLNDGEVRLALPLGFSYVTFGIEGTLMSDGNPTPKAHDGMAAFRLPNGNIRLIRNHEDRDEPSNSTLKGDPTNAYDPIGGGGCTSLEVEVTSAGERRLVRDFISINGTIVNCAGGPTPWGSWLTCEETTAGMAAGWTKPHGYVFEVPVSAEDEVPAIPYPALGRFSHEAVAVDPVSWVVYETEDAQPCGLYRFLPNQPGKLSEGGRLQMLAIRRRLGYDTRYDQRVGVPLPAEWVDIPDPDPADAESNELSVFQQGYARGGAIFSRLEGCWMSGRVLYFNATSGGNAELGQVWEYRPLGPNTGWLRLIFESPGIDVLSSPDNLTVSPRGGLVLCEDGDGAHQFLRGLTRDGRIFDFAEFLLNDREWCGATYSPDGQTLFVNIQGDTSIGGSGHLGYTFAIWGPWEAGAL